MSGAKQLGQWAELQAQHVLTQAGFQILHHNYHSRYGEIDLIAKRDQDILFVEVKARGRRAWANAHEVVTASKQLKIYKTGLDFLEKNPQLQDFYYRFDVICFDFTQEIAKNLHYDFSKLQYDQQWIENAFTINVDLINL